MCTVVIEVPPRGTGHEPSRKSVPTSVRLLAVRDEDPARPWDAPGAWWPEHPDVIGVRDRRAGGAWLAVSSREGRVAVLLNRAHISSELRTGQGLVSRGTLPLDAVTGSEINDPPGTAAFNLLSVRGDRAAVTMWDGEALTSQELDPGVHMIAHHDVDDVEPTPRIASWLPRFRELGGLPDGEWQDEWIGLLGESGALPPEDDRAIIRDNRSHGFPTLSLMVCLAEIDRSSPSTGTPSVALRTAILDTPGVWGNAGFE